LTDLINDDALGRIMSEIDDWGDYDNIRDQLQNRFPDWKDGRLDGFASAVKTKVVTEQKISWKREIIEHRTGLAGRAGHRISMITDDHGRYLGKPDNVQYYSKAGDGLWGVNTRTGRRAKLG